MPRPFPVAPLAAAVLRSPADGLSGTLGAGVVGPHELRPGAVALDRMADLAPGALLGRAGPLAGPPQPLDAAAVRALVEAGALALTFADRAAAEATAPDPATRLLRVLGWDVPGDGGAAHWRRVPAEPAHPGKLQTADGAWWALCEPEVRPEMFGAVAADAETDEGPQLAAALACAVATGRALALRGAYVTRQDLIVADPVVIRGDTGEARILFANASQLQFKRGDGSETISGVVLERVTFEDGGDLPAWHSKPVVESWRSARWRVIDCRFVGRNRRRHAAWFGRGSTIWGSSFDTCRFMSSRIGVVIGDTGDATHNRFTACTVDNNKTAGAIFCNPHGGIIHSNSFEFNQGRIGLAVLSRANGGGANALATSITGNYIFNNGEDFENDPDTVGLLIGHDVPGTNFGAGAPQFTSGGGAWALDVSNNYVVSDNQADAIRANMVQGGRIAFNVVNARDGRTTDIVLSGMPRLVDVTLNKNQNISAFDRVAATESWREPVATRGGVLNVSGAVETGAGRFAFRTGAAAVSDGRGGLAYRAAAEGAAGVPAPLLSLAEIAGADSALALVSVEAPNGSQRASFALHLSAAAPDGPLSPLSAAGETAGAAFALAGGAVTLTRAGAWRANVSLLFAGGPSRV